MDSRLIRARIFPKKPLLLKDYLLDDFDSCSSNGFKSFPRRQCCSSVPTFLRDFDPKPKRVNKRRLSFNKSALSAFRSVFTAVKRLPFSAGWRSPEKKRRKDAFQSFGSGLWKRKPEEGMEIVRWKSFDQLLKEDSLLSEGSYRWPAAVGRFDAECSSGNASTDVNLDVTVTVEANDVVTEETKEVVSGREAGVTNDDFSVESTTTSDGSVSTNSTNPKQKQWRSDQESNKEQFSPMSVLDCPFDDEEDEVSSPFQQRLARVEGTKKKLMKKIHMLESLAKLEPLNLATRFTSKPDSDNDSSSIDEKATFFDITEYCCNKDEEKASVLLHQIKSTIPSYNDDSNKLLVDFFRQGISRQHDDEEGLVKDARDWLHGQRPKGLVSDWTTVEQNREAYTKDMEKGGEWKTLNQEIKEVASMLENQVFDALLDDLLLDTIGN